ncbi:MAG TPA: succinylglutamate desuccinylase [Thermotogota bacterium]|nr:succinylglutamate desuccinylase [Thermotogota bacterium]HPJ88473.1 succinylglutamate desuccinylase [Thermotogota bacterium]HPR96488.1 succinylglutamate desuccinylase [Thermotogota bacterium]
MQISKIIVIAVLAVSVIAGGIPLYMQRNFEETVVASEYLTDTFMLSDYFPALKGTVADTRIYEFKGKEEGGSMLLIGGTHNSENCAPLTAFLWIENMKIDKGTVYVIPHFNRSGSLGTQPGGGFPLYYHFDTEWGEKQYRMGDRGLQALDQWPDPDVYAHYPEGQLLSYIDARNTNRTWPGRPNGFLSEQITYAAMQFIKEEKIDVVFDLHSAEVMFPVTNCIVVPEVSKRYAVGASLYVKGREKFECHVESSPENFRGLSHREISDNSDALVFLLEAPSVHLDQISGPKTHDLLMIGKDPFIEVADKQGILYAPIDETGWTIERRVGQHSSVTQEIINQFNKKNEDRAIEFEVPKYAEITEKGIGAFFHDPSKVPEERIFIE